MLARLLLVGWILFGALGSAAAATCPAYGEVRPGDTITHTLAAPAKAPAVRV